MRVFSKRDLSEGKILLKEKRVRTVLFSGGTYQIEVIASKKPKETLWTFFQLSDEGEILDAFCTCDTAEKKGSCSHLAAAYLKVMNDEPLHIRFRESLWNKIGNLSALRLGYDPKCLRGSKKGYEAHSQEGKRLFFLRALKPKAEKQIEEILHKRPIETEETSLKFSKLPETELALWREGRPSPRLSYELSFWSDLAKWWLLLQEEGVKYSLTFSEEEPPHFINIHFPELEIETAVEMSDWSELIPSLQTVDSPLKVYPYLQGKLENIVFLPGSGEISLEFAEMGKLPKEQVDHQKAIIVGDWLYFPGQGFFPKEPDPLFQQNIIGKDQVDLFLQRYLKLMQKYLTAEKFHPNPIPLRYYLFFDENHTLHIEAYLFEKGDILSEKSHFFGTWIYLKDKGFFPIENNLFDQLKLEIPKNKVSEFINRHRVWLHGYEGFAPHVSGVESHLGYRFNEEGKLVFYTKLEFTEEKENIIDLGEWIYVKGKGFYAKLIARPGAYIQPGMEVAPHEISSFIHQHREELEPIPKFFIDACPLAKTGLNIEFNEEGRIQISPKYFFAKEYEEAQVEIFGDYTFVAGKGFSLIPHESRLPQNYKKEKVIDRAAESYFVGYELDLLYPHVLSIDPKLKRPQTMDLRVCHLRREPSAKTGQWVLELQYETDIGIIDPHTIWEGIWQHKSYLFTDAGLLILRDKRFDWTRPITSKRWLKKGTALRLNTLEFLRLSALEELLEPKEKTVRAKRSRKLLNDFLHFKSPTEIDITGLKSDLRPYQKMGVDWLWFLHSYGLSGLLCDEMGLGKTHQAMALIAGVKNLHATRKAKFLVVCPTSVIYHWEKLIQTFLPDIKHYIFHGLGRRFKDFSEDSYDLLLTSYGITRTETQSLSNFHFDLAIFDELQIAKNQKSMTHKALRLIKATMRLGLSGTPIENRLLELKSLFDLILPNYLPSQSVFREFFINPIEKYQDEEKQILLGRLIRPFLLRRKKSEVLTELPEKIEEIALCDLSQEQRTLSKQIIQDNKNALLEALKDTNRPPPIAHVFSMLSKLKQVCNHPCLITGNLPSYKKHASGKWELFLELLDETRDSGQKLVIFSQYLGMLDIIGMHLKENKIGFAEIRGSTKKRKEEVERFSKDPACEVFLGSLQAAGVGIDLIAASVVIHYDRWWNPAKENQATDRVHRMGQKRGVQVFKLMTKDTIEEKIHTLIERKLTLAKGVIGFDTHDQVKGFEREDLIQILQELEV